MSDTIPFPCPTCGSTTFKSMKGEIKHLDDFAGATCTSCGRTMTEDDVKHHAGEVAKKLILDALKKR